MPALQAKAEDYHSRDTYQVITIPSIRDDRKAIPFDSLDAEAKREP